jgi:hypothetical protein
MNRNNFCKKVLVIGIIVLFIGTGFISSTVGIFEEKHCLKGDGLEKDSLSYSKKGICSRDDIDDVNYDVKIVYTTYNNEMQCEISDKSMYTSDSIEKKSFSGTTSEISDDGLHFYGETNRPFYVVRVSSPNEINLTKYVRYVHQNKTCNRSTRGNFYNGCLVTNKKEVTNRGGYAHRWERRDKINYFHCRFGKNIDYTYENMPKFKTFQYWVTESNLDPYYYTYPAGTWYFVWTGLIFDLEEEDVTTEMRVWMNFSGNCSDMEVEGFEVGETYYLWYGEFDSTLTISKHPNYRRMLNGRANFKVNNTFLYYFFNCPLTWWHRGGGGFGFWKYFWKMPHGRETFRMFCWNGHDWVFRGLKMGDRIPYDWKFGVGESGDYTLRTSYLDCMYELTESLYFIGFDVALP